MSSFVTRCRSSSSWSTSPKIDTSTIVSGKSENRTRYAIEAAYCGQRSRKRSSTARGSAFTTPLTMSSGPRRMRESFPPALAVPVSVTRASVRRSSGGHRHRGGAVRTTAVGGRGLFRLVRAQLVQDVRRHRRVLALHPARWQCLDGRLGAEPPERLVADEHTADRRLGLEPRCEVDDVPDDAVLAVPSGPADETGVHLAAVHADAEARPVLVLA